jgi:hypothetical protein
LLVVAVVVAMVVVLVEQAVSVRTSLVRLLAVELLPKQL